MATQKLILPSQLDLSINYIHETKGIEGYLESRYVQREDDYLIIYLSSHYGCNQSCKMCHLTHTNQTNLVSASLEDYIRQAKSVIKNIDFGSLVSQGLTKIKYSFMSRGEALLNETVLNDWDVLRTNLKQIVPHYLDVEFCISTIFPKEFLSYDKKLQDIFKTDDVILYWSIYSVNELFRKKWLGKALDIFTIKTILQEYIDNTNNIVKYHSSFIEGHNNSLEDIQQLKQFLDGIRQQYYQFNIIAFNSPDSSRYIEAPNLEEIKTILCAKTIQRVGYDVHASCGMFYNK